MLEAVKRLSVDSRVAIGIELDADGESDADPKVNLNVRNAKLGDVLDLIVKQEPDYRWELIDNVINFVPTRSRDPFLEKFLDINIYRFLPDEGINKMLLRNAVTDMPEVKALLESNGVSSFNVGISSAERDKVPADRDLVFMVGM